MYFIIIDKYKIIKNLKTRVYMYKRKKSYFLKKSKFLNFYSDSVKDFIHYKKVKI